MDLGSHRCQRGSWPGSRSSNTCTISPRDICRKIAGNDRLKEVFAKELMLARRVHAENKSLRPLKGARAEADPRVFSLPARG